MKFNKQQFEDATIGGQSAVRVEDGEYTASVDKFTLNKSTEDNNLAEQVVLIWRIAPDEDDFANCTIRWSQTVTNKDGDDNVVGLDMIAGLIKKLSDDQFNFEEFTFDRDGRIVNFNDVMKSFVGTSCKIKVIGEESGQYINYKVYVNDVYNMTYKPDPENKSVAVQMTEKVMDKHQAETNTEEEDAQIGQLVIFQRQSNTMEEIGKIIMFHDQLDQLMIEAERDKKTYTVKSELVRLPNPGEIEAMRITGKETEALEEDVLEEEEVLEEAPKLEIGAKVTAKWQNGTFDGTIHKIIEDEGLVMIAFIAADGKKKGRKVPMEDVVVL